MKRKILDLSRFRIAFCLPMLLLCLFGAWSRSSQALDCTPTSATLTYEADDYFKLYINGNEVSNGTAFDQGAPPATVTIPIADFNTSGTPDYFAAEIINLNPTEVGGAWLITINCSDGGTSYISDADVSLSFYDDLTGGSPPPANGGNQWYQQAWVDSGGLFCCAPIATTGVGWWFSPLLTNPLTGNPLPILSHATNGQDSSASEVLYYRENVHIIDITPTITPSPTITPTPYPPGCGPPTYVQSKMLFGNCLGSLGGGPSYSIPYSIPTDPNELLVFRVESTNPGQFSNVQWDGQTMTEVANGNDGTTGSYLETYVLANPTAGSFNFAFTDASGGCTYNIAAELYQNVNVLSPIGNTGTIPGSPAGGSCPCAESFNFSTTGPASLVSEYMASEQADSSGNQPTSTGAGQTSFALSQAPVMGCCNGVYGDYKTVNGPGTYTFSYTVPNNGFKYVAQPIEIEGKICNSPTNTPALSATFTKTETLGPSPTQTMTLTPAPTNTPAATPLPPTPTPLPFLLHPLPPNPDPARSSDGIYLPYWVQSAATVNIEVFTVSGEVVRNLDPFSAHAGNNEEYWDELNSSGNMVANGVFIIRIVATSTTGEAQSIFEKCSILR